MNVKHCLICRLFRRAGSGTHPVPPGPDSIWKDPCRTCELADRLGGATQTGSGLPRPRRRTIQQSSFPLAEIGAGLASSMEARSPAKLMRYCQRAACSVISAKAADCVCTAHDTDSLAFSICPKPLVQFCAIVGDGGQTRSSSEKIPGYVIEASAHLERPSLGHARHKSI